MAWLTIIFVLSVITVIAGGLFSHAFAESEIPFWFKHNAGWWGKGQIDDREFVDAVGYLIKKELLPTSIDSISSPSSGAVSVPDWIRNNAGWWGEGLISDDDFMGGIEFLVRNGLIGESSKTEKSLLDYFEVEKKSTPNGLEVTWNPIHEQKHTITSGTIINTNEIFDSGLISNQPFTFVFKNQGSYPYFCMIHPWESDTLYISLTELVYVEQEEQVEVKPEKKLIPSFVDPDKDPEYYINRYLTEPKYKEWFDTNYSDYTIYEAIDISEEEYQEIVQKLSEPEIDPEPVSEPEQTGTISNVLSFETPITNPKDVQNSEFYDVNTECQLKYFFYKDPTKIPEIVGLIIQSEERIEQEYFARAGQMGDSDLMREIMAEIVMEQYSINPVLKDKVITINADELSHEETQQIQQGTHPCEEEFELYTFGEGANNLAFTAKTFFEDTPISGAEIGQWVKYEIELSTSSNKNMRDLMNNQFSKGLSGANFDLDDVEWLKKEVIDISGNEITIQDEFKVRGKTSLFTDTTTYDFPSYGLFELFIPTNVEKGNILFRDNFFGDLSVVDFQKKNYGGKNIDTIHVMASVEINQAEGFIVGNTENYYDKKTGMLLEGQMGAQAATLSEGFDVGIQIKAIDFHIPSATFAVGGGGCLIATATYGSELATQVQQLREIRDNKLLQTNSGSSFMTGFNQFYYSFSPTVADWERHNPVFKEAVKLAITPLIASLSILNYVDIDSEAEMLGYGISLILLNVGMYVAAPLIVMMKIRDLYKNRYERST